MASLWLGASLLVRLALPKGCRQSLENSGCEVGQPRPLPPALASAFPLFSPPHPLPIPCNQQPISDKEFLSCQSVCCAVRVYEAILSTRGNSLNFENPGSTLSMSMVWHFVNMERRMGRRRAIWATLDQGFRLEQGFSIGTTDFLGQIILYLGDCPHDIVSLETSSRSPSCGNEKRLHIFPNAPWGTKSPQVKKK